MSCGQGVEPTRSKAYRKNDQVRIGQKKRGRDSSACRIRPLRRPACMEQIACQLGLMTNDTQTDISQ